MSPVSIDLITKKMNFALDFIIKGLKMVKND